MSDQELIEMFKEYLESECGDIVFGDDDLARLVDLAEVGLMTGRFYDPGKDKQ